MTDNMTALAAAAAAAANDCARPMDSVEQPLAGDLSAAVALYSQYAAAQRQYAAALAALPYATPLPYPYMMAAAAAAVAQLPQGLQMATNSALPSPLSLREEDDVEEAVVKRTALAGTFSSGSSGGESSCCLGGSQSEEPIPKVASRRSSNVNSKAVEEHIARLISENEALLEPSPLLRKRRSYTRQQYGSLDWTSTPVEEAVKSQPVVKSTRSQSLVDFGPLNMFRMKHVDSGLSTTRSNGDEPPERPLQRCAYCSAGFHSNDCLRSHEAQCAVQESDALHESGQEATSSSGSSLPADRFYPYCKTVSVPKLFDLEPARTSQSQTLIAQTTFCTVRRRPVAHCKIYDSGESVWTGWTLSDGGANKLATTRLEANANVMLIGCYQLKRHCSPFVYCVASKEGSQMHVTHSTYWKLMTAVNERLISNCTMPAVVDSPNSVCEEDDQCAGDVPNCDGAFADLKSGRRLRRPYACANCPLRFKTKLKLASHVKCKARSCVRGVMIAAGCLTSEHEAEADGDDEEDDEAVERPFARDTTDANISLERSDGAGRQAHSRDDCCPGEQMSTSESPLAVDTPSSSQRCESAPTPFTQAAVENCHSFRRDERSPKDSVVVSEAEQSSLVDNATPTAAAAVDSQTTTTRDIDEFISNSRDETKASCRICGKKFTRIGLLRLHMSAHCLEQSSRRYEIKCTECSASFRSKSLLQKHVDLAHAGVVENGGLSSPTDHRQRPSSSSSAAPPTGCCGEMEREDVAAAAPATQPSAPAQRPNPRPFVCGDCDVAFRIHGHLAKHLRSKLHIMKLESAGKLPGGSYGRIEETGVHILQEIDTRSVESSLQSLLSIVDRFAKGDDTGNWPASCRRGEGAGRDVAPAPLQEHDDDEDGHCPSKAAECSDSDELVIDVESCHSPVERRHFNGSGPPSLVDKNLTNSGEKVGNEVQTAVVAKSVTAGVWVPPVNDDGSSPPRLQMEVSRPRASKSKSVPSVARRPLVDCRGMKLDDAKTTCSTIERGADADNDASTENNNYCHWCKISFATMIDLSIHRLSDHIVIMDGCDFRCPFSCCERVYPNRGCFRNHLMMHFTGQIQDLCDVTVDEASNRSNGLDCAMDESSTSKTSSSRRRGSAFSCQKKRRKLPAGQDNNGYAEQPTPAVGVLVVTSVATGVGYSSTSDSETSHLSHSNCSPVTSPPNAAPPPPCCAAGTSAMEPPVSVPRQRRQSQKRPALGADHSPSMAVTLVTKRSSLVGDLPPGAFEALHAQMKLEDSAPAQSVALSQCFSLPSHSPSQSGFVPWSSAGAAPTVLKSSMSPQSSFYGAQQQQQQQLAGGAVNQWTSPAAQPDLAAAFAQAAAAVSANPAALFSYQAMCQQLAAASLFGAVQQAQCGAISPALLAALNPAAAAAAAAAATAANFQRHMPPPSAPASSTFGNVGGQQQQVVGNATPSSVCFCLVCGKQCANVAEYQEHMVSHSQPRPFLCEVCDAGFTSARALQLHQPCKQRQH